MSLLIPARDYPAIRAALDTRLDATLLPDAVIGQPIYAGAAERAVTVRDPNWASRPADAQQRLVEAVILLTAALLAPVVPQLTSERLGDRSNVYQARDWDALAAALRARAEAELTAVVDGRTAVAPPVMVAAAPGGRGR